MNKLPTASELLEEIRKHQELRKLLPRKAQWALIALAEKEKAACSQQTA